MGVWETVKGVIGDVWGAVERLIDYVSDPDKQENIKRTIEFFLIIISAVGALNEPIPKRDKHKTERLIIDVFRKLTLEDLDKMIELLPEVAGMTNGEIDQWHGMALGPVVDKAKGRIPSKGGKSA